MARADQLLASYRRHVSLTPRANLPLSQRLRACQIVRDDPDLSRDVERPGRFGATAHAHRRAPDGLCSGRGECFERRTRRERVRRIDRTDREACGPGQAARLHRQEVLDRLPNGCGILACGRRNRHRQRKHYDDPDQGFHGGKGTRGSDVTIRQYSRSRRCPEKQPNRRPIRSPVCAGRLSTPELRCIPELGGRAVPPGKNCRPAGCRSDRGGRNAPGMPAYSGHR